MSFLDTFIDQSGLYGSHLRAGVFSPPSLTVALPFFQIADVSFFVPGRLTLAYLKEFESTPNRRTVLRARNGLETTPIPLNFIYVK